MAVTPLARPNPTLNPKALSIEYAATLWTRVGGEMNTTEIISRERIEHQQFAYKY